MSALNSEIQYLSGVGPKRAALLRSELGVETFGDLLRIFPFRYIDRTSITPIRDARGDLAYVQIQGTVVSSTLIGPGGSTQMAKGGPVEIRAAKRLKEISGMDRVFFTNSGAESNEGALKAAMKYAWLKDKDENHNIVALENSFHGRTYGALAVTGNAHYREPFGQMVCDVRFGKMNDFESVKEKCDAKTAAIILEVVQGEGGLIPANKEFLESLRAFCTQRDILLIFDEVQCGMGRTGYMYAWQKFGVKPDIMTTAKALGCGVPVGAFLMTEHVAEHSLTAGDHGTTYGGNPFACAAINKVLDLYESTHLVEHVRDVAPYLEKTLDGLKDRFDCITERRGSGLMQGLVFDRPVRGIIDRAMENGLILINAGPNILRFVPPLIVTEKEIDEMAEILSAAIEA